MEYHSLPSRDVIADSVEYSKRTLCEHWLYLKLRQNNTGYAHGCNTFKHTYDFVSGGPMEAGKTKLANHN